jgi:cell filamentation protein
MFDPFNDFSTAGYLRNKHKEQDSRIVKNVEHEAFARNLPKALQYLSKIEIIAYEDFLQVHKILFSEFYPWAGQDRTITAPNLLISKGNRIQFCSASEIRFAINEGLRLAQDKGKMPETPGQIMGFFAYAHPFLDGNGRTILLIHLELAYRAGISISWSDTNKTDYLNALTHELERPKDEVLDTYLLKFKGPRLEREEWKNGILSIRGLNGLDEDNKVEGDLSDESVAEKYRKFEEQRGYTYKAQEDSGVCNQYGAVPCICNSGSGSKPKGP